VTAHSWALLFSLVSSLECWLVQLWPGFCPTPGAERSAFLSATLSWYVGFKIKPQTPNSNTELKCKRNFYGVSSFLYQLVSGFTSAFVYSIPLLAVLRFVVGFGLTGVMLSQYIYLLELVGPNTRTAAGNMTYFYYNGFQMLCVLIAYFERDWRNLIMIVTLPAVLLFPFWK